MVTPVHHGPEETLNTRRVALLCVAEEPLLQVAWIHEDPLHHTFPAVKFSPLSTKSNGLHFSSLFLHKNTRFSSSGWADTARGCGAVKT